MSAPARRLRVVQVQVTVVTAVDDGTDLHVTPNPQPVTIPTLRALQEFATIHLPAALAEQERTLNATPEPSRPANRAERRASSKRGTVAAMLTPNGQAAPTEVPA